MFKEMIVRPEAHLATWAIIDATTARNPDLPFWSSYIFAMFCVILALLAAKLVRWITTIGTDMGRAFRAKGE